MSCEQTCSSASNPAECMADCEENTLLKRVSDELKVRSLTIVYVCILYLCLRSDYVLNKRKC